MSHDADNGLDLVSPQWLHALVLAATEREVITTRDAAQVLLESVAENRRQLAKIRLTIRAIPDASMLGCSVRAGSALARDVDET